MKQHPNSLKQLMPPWNSETAKAASLKAAEVRKANKAARDALKMSMADWKFYKTEVLENHSLEAVDILRVLMHKALMAENFDIAADLAKTLAEFERPKLARVEQKIEEVNTEQLTDEQLQEMLKKAVNS